MFLLADSPNAAVGKASGGGVVAGGGPGKASGKRRNVVGGHISVPAVFPFLDWAPLLSLKE